MEGIMIRLNDLLAKYDAVLVDGSVKRVRTDFSRLMSSESYLGYDLEILQRDNQRLWHFAQLLNHPNTYTINGVTSELKALSEIVDDKLSRLPRSRHKHTDTFTAITREMARMQDSLSEILSLSESKELMIIDVRYELLVQMVKDINKVTGLKEKAKPYVSYSADALSSHEPKVIPRDTDERLIAALYWMNMHTDAKSCLLSKDKDFMWLIRYTPRLMSDGAFMPFNEDFRSMAAEKSLDVYMPSKILPYFTRVDNTQRQRGDSSVPENVDQAQYLKGRLGHLWRGYHQMRPIRDKELKLVAL